MSNVTGEEVLFTANDLVFSPCKCKLGLMVSFMVNKRCMLVLSLPENVRVEVAKFMGKVTGPLFGSSTRAGPLKEAKNLN